MTKFEEYAAAAQEELAPIIKRNKEFSAKVAPALDAVVKELPETIFGKSPFVEDVTERDLPSSLPAYGEEPNPHARFMIHGQRKGLIWYREPQYTGAFSAYNFGTENCYNFELEQLGERTSRITIAEVEMRFTEPVEEFQTNLRNRLIQKVAISRELKHTFE